MAMIEITIETYRPYKEKTQMTIHVLQDNFNAIRAGRANPHVLERVMIDYYGVQTPINQVANIQIPEARMITITPWDPTTLKTIERAIQASDIGINPNNDGKMLRLTFPPLTEDRRRDLVKTIHRYAEESRIAIRNIRREALDKYRAHLKKKEITEDTLSEIEKSIQELTDKYIAEIDALVVEKEKDLMEL